jgi:GT2 family glycosyltransferase
MGERLSPSASRPPELADLPTPAAGRTGWPWTAASPRLPERLPHDAPWPRITIVTPSYNQAEFLEETLRSVLLQGYPNLEYFVMDGGSTDHSLEIIQRYAPWLTGYVSERDRGQSHGINKGFARATGEILGWLNSDDTFEPGALGLIAQAFDEHPQAFLISGKAYYIARNSQRTGQPPARAFDRQWMLTQENSIPQPSAFFSRQGWQTVGALDETLHFTMDYDLWFRLGERGPAFFIPEFLSNQRIYPQAKTSAGDFRFYREVSLVSQRYGGSGLPAGFQTWVAEMHLPKAWAAYAAGQVQTGASELGYVLEHAPAWRVPQRLAPEIARYAWGLSVGLSGQDTAALDFAERVCAHLPAAVAQPVRLRRHVLAALHQASAQRHFARGEPAQVWRSVGQSLIHEPRRARDRGLWSLAARSLGRARPAAPPLAQVRLGVLRWLETAYANRPAALEAAALVLQLRALWKAEPQPPTLAADWKEYFQTQLALALQTAVAEDSLTWQPAVAALIGLRRLGLAVSQPLDFIEPLHSAKRLNTWLETLDWLQPLSAGSAVQRLAICLVQEQARTGQTYYSDALQCLRQWLGAHQGGQAGPWTFGQPLPLPAALTYSAYLSPVLAGQGLPLPGGEGLLARVLDQQRFSGLFSTSAPDPAWADFAAADALARLRRQSAAHNEQAQTATAFARRALLHQQQADGSFAPEPKAAGSLRDTWLRSLNLAVLADDAAIPLPPSPELGSGND